MSRKMICFLWLTLMGITAGAQDIYFTRTGKIEFHSGSSIEDIDGVNNEATSMLNIKTGEMAFTLLVKSFTFKRALMEEHFNENVYGKHQISKAPPKEKSFRCPLSIRLHLRSYNIQTEGELTIHGVTKKVTVPGKISVSGGKITGTANFKIILSDFNIQIPGVVAEKFAKETTINISCIYEPRS